MSSDTVQAFRFPDKLESISEKLDFTLSVIGKYQSEGRYLRRQVFNSKRQRDKASEEVEKWKKKYEEEKEEKNKLKKEIDKLVTLIEKLTKTNSRYSVALFDHGNFKSPSKEERKQKGGQPGHKDTNREDLKDKKSFQKVRLFAKNCQTCGTSLPRVNGVKEKLLVDIKINPEIIKLLVQSERQWCKHCHQEVNSKCEFSLPFTEYGTNTFLMVLLLRFGSGLTLGKIATVLEFGFGLQISKSEIASLLARSKIYLKGKYEQLKSAARKRQITYHDETGWLVHGQAAWMWIMVTNKETIYVAAESRGKGIAKDNYASSQSFAMHDGLASYEEIIPKDKHLFCWAHVLRFAFEETVKIKNKKNSDGIKLRDKLVWIYHLKKNNPHWTKEELGNSLRKEIDLLLDQNSKEQSFQNIQKRLNTQKEGLIRALILTPDGTNNLAERELRPLVISRKSSFGSDTFKGMETTAILGTVIRSTTRQVSDPLPKIKYYLKAGVSKSYPQYLHAAFIDSP